MSNISKLDYLQRYLSKEKQNEKKISKKKKKVKKSHSNIKIIDNDIAINEIVRDVEYGDEFDLEEEKPLIYAEDGTTLTKELKDEQKTVKWNPLYDESLHKSKNDINNCETDSDVSVERAILTKKYKSVRHSRQRHDSSSSDDLSPVRKSRKTQDSDSDLSPQRNKRNDSESDISPPRKKKYDNRQNKRKEYNPEVIKECQKSGLRTGSELREENKIKKQNEKLMFDKMDKSVSGKEAGTVYRDRKTGKKIDIKFEELKKRREEEKKLEDQEQFKKWGKGLAQEKSQHENIADHLHESEKPLARYKDDSDLDNLLKKTDRDGDPMLAYLNKKKTKVSKVAKPRYNGPSPAPNRFNIWPGYRYDGVDRSNGFEKKRFLAITDLKSLKNDAYKWSTEEM